MLTKTIGILEEVLVISEHKCDRHHDQNRFKSFFVNLIAVIQKAKEKVKLNKSADTHLKFDHRYLNLDLGQFHDPIFLNKMCNVSENLQLQSVLCQKSKQNVNGTKQQND